MRKNIEELKSLILSDWNEVSNKARYST
jgi:hypothetical protein